MNLFRGSLAIIALMELFSGSLDVWVRGLIRNGFFCLINCVHACRQGVPKLLISALLSGPICMGRTRVKICGITREQDLDAAVSAGVDAVGFVFYAKSPRAVSLDDAASLARRLPAFVTPVALFVDPSPEFVIEVTTRIPQVLLQFHGNEQPGFCASFGRPYMRALRMAPDLAVAEVAQSYPGASAVLLDSYKPGVPGGTGETFDWSRVPARLAVPLILAGGLDASNVAHAVRQVRPYAVDVSGGVEAAPGLKDPGKMRAFVAAVQSVDAELSA